MSKKQLQRLDKEELIVKLTRARNCIRDKIKKLKKEKEQITFNKIKMVVNFLMENQVINNKQVSYMLTRISGIIKAEKKLKIRTGIDAQVNKYREELG
ncbi:MAG: hypothetical protein KKF56_05160 [Nanoarchaeota archaeon]|nr:hypothetical protein [Nanoarchaeota archaeon]